MIVLLWASVFFSVGGSYVYSDASVWGIEDCFKGFCITLNEAEITAEAGLCVVIPCSFTTSYSFTPKHLVWYKCDHSKLRCTDSDIIFHSNNKKVQVEYEGRVSLLEPDVSQKNCSIVINDLRESDSGSYQLKVHGLLYQRTDGFTYDLRTTVSVKGLHQKPTVLIPPLTEGQSATLTCTAPGFCSGYKSEITWMWGDAGGKNSHISGNITAETKTQAAFTRTRSSSLTFNLSAEHHNTNITCKVNFVGGRFMEETVTLHVNYTRKPQISGSTTVQEGDVLNLTCSVDSFPPSKTRWAKFQNVNGDLSTDKHNSTTYLQGEGGTISVFNVTAEDSGLYVCTAEYLNTTKTEEINVTVTCLHQKPTVLIPPLTEGQPATLTCTAPGFCSGYKSEITWMWGDAGGKNAHISGNITAETKTQAAFTRTRSSSLTFNLSAEHHNTNITCKVNFVGGRSTEETVTLHVNYMKPVTVSGNRSVREGETLNLTCSVDSFPPSVLTWAKLSSSINLPSNTGSVPLVVSNMTAEHFGLYTCTAKHLNMTRITYADVTVRLDCGSQSGILPWVIAGVSLSMNVCCVICMCYFWNAKRKVKPTQEDRAYMSLKKRDPSAEYEVIGPRRTDSSLHPHRRNKLPEILKLSNERRTESRGRETVQRSVKERGTERVCPVVGKTKSLQLQFKMIVLLWASVFFSVGGSYVYSDASAWGKEYCIYGFCITLNEAEITAEAGLCVVIPCSFTTSSIFTPKHLVWYKCDHSKLRCTDSDIIFHSNNKRVQVEYEGRVSLLEPDVSQKNCSIVINDVRESDSGSYQLKVHGLLYQRTDGFTYDLRTTVSVKGLHQKPTVLIPPLTEGQPATLTCTAPGLCSGSKPQITWMWRGVEQDFDVTGNITTETKTLAAVTHTHSSSLTFNPSAEHHNTNITCKVNFVGGSRTEETVTLHVNYTRKPQISGSTTVQEGDVLNLTCSVDSFPPSKIRWAKFQNVNGDLSTDKHNSTTYLQGEGGTISVFNVAAEDSGLYVCTAEYLNTTKTEEINVTVTCLHQKPTVLIPPLTEGQPATLTCTAPGLCSGSKPQITWMWGVAGEKNAHISGNITAETKTQAAVTHTHSSSLTFNPSAEHHNTNITCKVNFVGGSRSMEETVTLHVNYMKPVTVSGNRSVREGETLNLTCSVDSFPPSVLTWAKLSSSINLPSNTGSVTLVVSNMTAEHFGLYTCTAKHLNMTRITYAYVTVRLDCGSQSGILPWVIVGVSLSMNVCCVICMCYFWNAKQKVKPTQEDRAYMSLKKRDPSAEYEVIGPHRTDSSLHPAR
ncbi:uncharacterized protein ACNS7B_019034 [Menidia menidia]